MEEKNEEIQDVPQLELVSMIGFNGADVPGGLKVHPDGQHLIYPVGCTVVIENIGSGKQDLLSGHTDSVSCLAVSRSGRYIASGQITHMGFKAKLILWDFKDKKQIAEFVLHVVKVQAVAFSPNDKYLVSLGGSDDGSVVVWDLATRTAICGAPAQSQSAGNAYTVMFTKDNDWHFLTGGNKTLRAWTLDRPNRKIIPTDVSMGQLKRVINCMEIGDEKHFYCGTSTGDILCISMNFEEGIFNLRGRSPEKNNFSLGITALAVMNNKDLLVGAGDGKVAIVKGIEQKFCRVANKCQSVNGEVTSLALRGGGHQFFCGTKLSSIYRFSFNDFSRELIKSCHPGPVKDIDISLCNDLLLTCSKEDIRVWHTSSYKELLRITVHNVTCNAVAVTCDGTAIVSGWDDGSIRAFYPKSGKEMYKVNNAHNSVTAMATFNRDPHMFVSGAKGGMVCVWQVEKYMGQAKKGGASYTTSLVCTLKEQQAEITCIKLTHSDKRCVTSSDDGTVVIWDLENKLRLQMIRMNTLFKFACYHPQEHQVLATGTNHKISYQETADGVLVRELDGAKQGSINGLSISRTGLFFVSAGDNRIVKLWDYEAGEPLYVGLGHSATVSRVEISPQDDFIVSVGTDGAILFWNMPDEIRRKCQEQY